LRAVRRGFHVKRGSGFDRRIRRHRNPAGLTLYHSSRGYRPPSANSLSPSPRSNVQTCSPPQDMIRNNPNVCQCGPIRFRPVSDPRRGAAPES
jgi:hypothetical protein